jgi:hypothetical protein
MGTDNESSDISCERPIDYMYRINTRLIHRLHIVAVLSRGTRRAYRKIYSIATMHAKDSPQAAVHFGIITFKWKAFSIDR